jgi:superfamily I DNA and RNA helicase
MPDFDHQVDAVRKQRAARMYSGRQSIRGIAFSGRKMLATL